MYGIVRLLRITGRLLIDCVLSLASDVWSLFEHLSVLSIHNYWSLFDEDIHLTVQRWKSLRLNMVKYTFRFDLLYDDVVENDQQIFSMLNSIVSYRTVPLSFKQWHDAISPVRNNTTYFDCCSSLPSIHRSIKYNAKWNHSHSCKYSSLSIWRNILLISVEFVKRRTKIRSTWIEKTSQ
jgi:hypothetical protein